jgi:hypothetical protein
MATIRVTMASAPGDSMLMHNERLADPLNPYTRWLAELTGKRNKTEADHGEIARREFLGSGYWAVDEGPTGQIRGPVIPTWNIIRCLQAGATRQKLGKHVVRALIPTTMFVPLQWAGQGSTNAEDVLKEGNFLQTPAGIASRWNLGSDAAELWKTGLHYNRKGVVIGGRRTMRTRPCFTDWKVEADLELDLTILDPDKVDQIARDAGMYEGLGDNRPMFGRFLGSAQLLADPIDLIASDELKDQRERAAVESATGRVAAIDAERAENHPNGKERRKRVEAAVS